jgi:hypothetical protein
VSIDQTGRSHVLHAVGHRPEIGETHDGAFTRGDDEWQVIDRFQELVVAMDFPTRALVSELSFRPIRIGLRKHIPHLLERDPVFVQDRRVQLHAHGRECAATDGHLSHAVYL